MFFNSYTFLYYVPLQTFNIMIRKGFFVAFSVVLWFISTDVFSQNVFDKKDFYRAIASSNTADWDAQLHLLKKYMADDRGAYEGAMLMRKSARQTIPAKKLSMFKQGHRALENAIAKNPGNAEFRFLRLMVQENAPKALGYHKNIAGDSRMVRDQYKKLPAVVQQAIAGYSKKSKALPPGSI